MCLVVLKSCYSRCFLHIYLSVLVVFPYTAYNIYRPGLYETSPCSYIFLLFLVPARTLLEVATRAPKNIQRTPNRQIDLSVTQLLHQRKVVDVPSSSCVSHRDAAPLGQLADELVVDAALETLDIGCVDEKLSAVRL